MLEPERRRAARSRRRDAEAFLLESDPGPAAPGSQAAALEALGLRAPPPIDRAARLRALTERCQAAGIPATTQRKIVLSAVMDLGTHPTADDVFDHLAEDGQSISRATVFRTLETLAELGLIAKTDHPGRGVRYCRENMPHHHLVCLRCDAMLDFLDDSFDALPIPDTSKLGFRVVDTRVQVRGVCRHCQEKDRAEAQRAS